MLCLAIHVYENSSPTPTPTIRIPLKVASTVVACLPTSLKRTIAAKAIDLDELVRAAQERIEPGVLVEIEDEEDRVVIAIERLGKSQGETLPQRS